MLLFWFLTIVLFSLALCFMFPWLKYHRFHFLIYSLMLCLSYSLYFIWGSSFLLRSYYSTVEETSHEQMVRLRSLFIELKKQEYRLSQHLEQFPKDNLAHSQLLELFAIEALQQGNKELAKQYLETAFNKINNPKKDVSIDISAYKARKKHLQLMLGNL